MYYHYCYECYNMITIVETIVGQLQRECQAEAIPNVMKKSAPSKI